MSVSVSSLDASTPALSPGSFLPLSRLLCPFGFHQDIKARSVAWKTEGVCSTKAGSRPGNTRKNRYKDVVPCKSVGVLLAQMLGGSAHRGERPPISQSVLPHTFEVAALFPEATRGQIPTRVLSLCLLLDSHPSLCLTLWQMMRQELSFPCSRRRDMEITSMPTSSGSGW